METSLDARPREGSIWGRRGAGRLGPDEFGALYREHYPALRIVAGIEAGREHAEDVVQQAAVTALERIERFERGTDFRAWMSAIVRGAARNHRRGVSRARARDLKAGRSPERTAGEERPETPGVRPGDRAPEVRIPEGLRENVRNAVERLEPLPRACLLLKSVVGASYSEISVMLEMPEATVRSHVFRARKAILARLEDGGDKRSQGKAPGV